MYDCNSTLTLNNIYIPITALVLVKAWQSDVCKNHRDPTIIWSLVFWNTVINLKQKACRHSNLVIRRSIKAIIQHIPTTLTATMKVLSGNNIRFKNNMHYIKTLPALKVLHWKRFNIPIKHNVDDFADQNRHMVMEHEKMLEFKTKSYAIQLQMESHICMFVFIKTLNIAPFK